MESGNLVQHLGMDGDYVKSNRKWKRLIQKKYLLEQDNVKHILVLSLLRFHEERARSQHELQLYTLVSTKA